LFPSYTVVMADIKKKNVLVIGGGSVGAIAALNLDVGGLANVTIALRSNYIPVFFKGYDIESCDHGKLEGWRPSSGTLFHVAH
jgi:ketopantoate reductase